MSAAMIRIATPEDAAGVSQLLEASYCALLAEAYPPDILGQVLPVMTRAQPVLLSSGRSFVAEEAGRLLAFGGWSPDEPGSRIVAPGLGHLRHFAVRPEALRRGLARRIAGFCARQAREDGRERWRVFASLNAVPFYRSLGLAEVRRTEIPIGPVTLPICLMEGPIALDADAKTPG